MRKTFIHIGHNATRADTEAAIRIRGHLARIGIDSDIKKQVDFTSSLIILGTPSSNPALDVFLKENGASPQDSLGRDGFIIRTFRKAEVNITALFSTNTFGVLCAYDEFRQKVKTPNDLDHLNIMENPAFEEREYKMTLPSDNDFIIDRRINTISLNSWHVLNSGFEGIYAGQKLMKELIGEKFDDRSWYGLTHENRLTGNFPSEFSHKMEEWYETFRKRLKEISSLGVDVLFSRYEMAYPGPDYFFRYFPEDCLGPDTSGELKVICPLKQKTKDFFSLIYRKTFELFPEFNGVLVYLSGEGGARMCMCEDCSEAFEIYYRKELPDIPGIKEVPKGELRKLWMHNRFFNIIYDAIRTIRPDAQIIRNVWEFSMAKWRTEFAHATIPKDVILRPYTTSGDTNLIEPPSPEITYWTENGHKVSPKMCQILEMHCRTQAFPNIFYPRIREFYKEWKKNGVYGIGLHGGWLPSETMQTYLSHEKNIGTGFNFTAHFKLLWNPDRTDIESLYDEWLRESYGECAGIAKKYLERASLIYKLDKPVKAFIESDDPVKTCFPIFVYCIHYILLCNKYLHWYFGMPGRFDREFLYKKEMLPEFYEKLDKALELLKINIDELEKEENSHDNIQGLARWFATEKKYLEAIKLLYKAQEIRLIQNENGKAASYYAEAGKALYSTLKQWSHIALENKIWTFADYGKYHPYYFSPIRDTPPETWLSKGFMGAFFKRLEKLAKGEDITGESMAGIIYDDFEESLGSFVKTGPVG